jgi:DsbC/DsbD-like thiol-disulfide interchange protein
MTGIVIPPQEATTVQFGWKTPPGTEVNEEAPFRILWDQSEGLAEAPADVRSTGSAVKNGFSVRVRPTPKATKASLAGELAIVVCEAKNKSVCLPVKRRVELAFLVLPDAGAVDPALAIVLPSAK